MQLFQLVFVGPTVKLKERLAFSYRYVGAHEYGYEKGWLRQTGNELNRMLEGKIRAVRAAGGADRLPVRTGRTCMR